VASAIKRRMRESKLTLKQAVNDVLRAGLVAGRDKSAAGFAVEPHACGFKPGIDLDRMNQLVDELEVEDNRRKMAE